MSMMVDSNLPVAVIGGGPVGLAAAARLVSRGIQPLIFERGASVGAAMLEWGHVRVFSPWRYNIDAAARALLEKSAWSSPSPDALPTGSDIVRDYLAPLAALPEIGGNLKLGATVTAITRQGHDKVCNDGRESSPFVIRYQDESGEHRALARSVIDASGTWTRPNPMGVDGLPVPGEREAAGLVDYGIPDVVGARRTDYAGKRVLVIGGGHSAINAALALMELQGEVPTTEIFWALRRNSVAKLLGGGLNDQLPERGALGLAAKQAMEDGSLKMLAPFAVDRIETEGKTVAVEATLAGKAFSLFVDRIIVTTGFRPDLSFLGELRVALDPAVEAPPALAPLIDPNFHSCGTVPPHGIAELAHPEPGFVIVGSKSYGRAPTFLMATGYEQVRSVVTEIAGDHVAAREVHLVLPETGVCSAGPITGDETSGCCGGPAPIEANACCVRDADAKAAGASGCSCGTSLPVAKAETREPTKVGSNA
ncbi:Pyridine nucleotide-disulphide oxidoreductase [Mesorhizobium albiziae]|uniref:Pyridine nucleotide-disulphide oxidoreductase n=1 Tax=Neomesorhizobium albiziae TaxID=335020 RepID=A0A1I4CTS1_9HYPH|nr:NAD(P)-binding domain-containing protein [Mesorhizobium albiziae]GLS31036.1 flavoprotein [Mesorhizobium albiziae]SFK84662.1 Pyridine nucleotide-disulphide oxidoreductase [Mesorhizobium albiziae]